MPGTPCIWSCSGVATKRLVALGVASKRETPGSTHIESVSFCSLPGLSDPLLRASFGTIAWAAPVGVAVMKQRLRQAPGVYSEGFLRPASRGETGRTRVARARMHVALGAGAGRRSLQPQGPAAAGAPALRSQQRRAYRRLRRSDSPRTMPGAPSGSTGASIRYPSRATGWLSMPVCSRLMLQGPSTSDQASLQSVESDRHP